MPRRNCHCSGVTSIQLPLAPSMAFLTSETSMQRVKAFSAKLSCGRSIIELTVSAEKKRSMATSYGLIATFVPHMDPAEGREENLTACAAKILVRLNLMIWNAAIYSTLVVQDIVMA